MKEKILYYINISVGFMNKYFNNEIFLLKFLNIFCLIYLFWGIYNLWYDKLLLLIVILLILLLYKHLKDIVKKISIDKQEKLITFNLIFLLFNILNIFFNILRGLFKNYIIYFRKMIYEIINFNLEESIVTKLIDNILSLISLQTCYILLSIYISYNLNNILFDYDKPDMTEYDTSKCWVIKYPKMYKNILLIWASSFICYFFIVFLFAIKMNMIWLDIIILFSTFIVLCFWINALYVVILYYKR